MKKICFGTYLKYMHLNQERQKRKQKKTIDDYIGEDDEQNLGDC